MRSSGCGRLHPRRTPSLGFVLRSCGHAVSARAARAARQPLQAKARARLAVLLRRRDGETLQSSAAAGLAAMPLALQPRSRCGGLHLSCPCLASIEGIDASSARRRVQWRVEKVVETPLCRMPVSSHTRCTCRCSPRRQASACSTAGAGEVLHDALARASAVEGGRDPPARPTE
ncbi:hypothetical protein FA09DRAFT_172132 [Tilletiopsis washingtonensis]|uniref:Uncharacterized protein n=1 Tax=Tilletiopsis washingtonensis TaxID=58919 RepID=A0A316Z053_9BASI|nr:hypothetical protein FA09DRAFT_172132 [Tilletiopsis washingtonensis]PWN94666.1 hypothetical protein FA09DRAFT_172132 [Tilletiopsis washingtonensis]